MSKNECQACPHECQACPHEGHGSEHCSAGWGDYCPLVGEYILMTPQDEAEYFRIWGELPPKEFRIRKEYKN